METIFLSHASIDYTDSVAPLAGRLKALGCDVCVLNNLERQGPPFEAVNEALRACTRACIFISSAYLGSNWCMAEISALWHQYLKRGIPLQVLRVQLSERAVLTRFPLLATLEQLDAATPVQKLAERIIGSSTSSAPRPQNQGPIPVVLAGCGQWAMNRTVLPLLQAEPDLLQVVGVCELIGQKTEYEEVIVPALRAVGADPSQIVYKKALYQLLEELPQRPLAVSINTPNSLHDSLASHALEYGCDVFAERPVTDVGTDLPLLIAKARAKQLFFYTGTQRRTEDSYAYLRHAIASRTEFGNLASIRCVLASGRRLQGWRTQHHLSGGGVVLDEGYHLLDASAWLAMASHPILAALNREQVKGFASFRYGQWKDIETSAYGQLRLAGVVDICFDLSYVCPEDSIFEVLDLRDQLGARIRLKRDMSVRNSTPGVIEHQAADGRMIKQGFVHRAHSGFDFAGGPAGASANNSGPLRQFLNKVRSGRYEPYERLELGVNDCDSRFVAVTQELVAAIYSIA